MVRTWSRRLALASLTVVLVVSGVTGRAQVKPRARDLGIPFNGRPGPLNAITDVRGVEIGHATIISGSGPLVVGRGPIRTGVTAILPRGKAGRDPVPAAWFTLNGNGEMTGTTWVQESGFLWGPVMITNTHSVGTVHTAVLEWIAHRRLDDAASGDFSLPVVAETWDGFLNDINGFHVTREHAFQALDHAASGPVTEGNVGGGTGMIAHRFKGGIGTASRVLPEDEGGYVVGVLVQANYGSRRRLTIAGVPVGLEITDLMPEGDQAEENHGSIIVVVATDAPLVPHQLKRVATRAALGVGRVGGAGEDSSGDIFLAFSTANTAPSGAMGPAPLLMLPNERINGIFYATVDATEEAIVNALVAAEDMEGRDGHKVYALPHDRLKAVMKKYGR